MNTIIIIEDDIDDQDIIRTILHEMRLENDIKFFDNGKDAFEFISKKETIPSIIISDINMPGMNGFELRDKIHEEEDLRVKCIPYLFLTNGGESRLIWQAYAKSAQGFFIKPSSLQEWKKLLYNIVDYWGSSKKPVVK